MLRTSEAHGVHLMFAVASACNLKILAGLLVGLALVTLLSVQKNSRVLHSTPENAVWLAHQNFQDADIQRTKADQGSYENCKPRTNIMFLKTHKCASTTIQNILMRFGDQRNLTFVLPLLANNLGDFTTNQKFTGDLTLPLPSVFSSNFNIFCHHARWNEEEIAKLMPADTLYISTVREPAAMFESLYAYYRFQEGFGVPLEEFILNPTNFTANKTNSAVKYVFARNPMLSDFGILGAEQEDNTVIQKKLKELEQRFALIMIADQMEESLVLLRELLFWKWKDVVAFRMNSRKDRVKLSSKTRVLLATWNRADHMLYKYFVEIFEQKKLLYGLEKLAADVRTLRTVTRAWKTWCVDEMLGNRTSSGSVSRNDLFWEEVPDSLPRIEALRTCSDMCLDELQYSIRLRAKLWPNYESVGRSGRQGVNNAAPVGTCSQYSDDVT